MSLTELPAGENVRKAWRIAFTVIVALGLLTRFAGFAHRTEAAIDEMYFSQYLSAYFTHRFYFDTHPPFGKLLVAGFASLWNFQPVMLDMKWDASFSDHNAAILRFLPSLAGALLPAVILLLARELGLTLRYAVFAAVLVVLENALIAHSRFVYFDNFLLLFGFLALWFALRAIRSPSTPTFIAVGAFAGMACATKWTALTFVLLIGGLMSRWLFTRKVSVAEWLRFLIAIASAIVVVYIGTFAAHFALLYLPGPGDPFMPAAFQQTLSAHAANESTPGFAPGFWQTLVDVHREMFLTNQRINGDHPYGSKWFQWPWMWKPIYYLRVPLSADGSADSHTYSMPNPIVWLGVTFAVMTACCVLAWQIARRSTDRILLWLVVGYLVSWLPFALIHRVMFLYHYFVALIFGILILARLAELEKWRKGLILFSALALLGFVSVSPVTYGWPINLQRIDNSPLHIWR